MDSLCPALKGNQAHLSLISMTHFIPILAFCIWRTLHWSRGAYSFLMSLFFLLRCRANLPAVIKQILLGMHKGPIEPLIWPARSSSFRRSCRGFWGEPGAWLAESLSFGSNSCCYCMIEVVLEEGLCTECLWNLHATASYYIVCCKMQKLNLFFFNWSLRMWIKPINSAWPFVWSATELTSWVLSFLFKKHNVWPRIRKIIINSAII